MTKSVYQANEAHFALVKAYVIVNERGDQVGILNVKYPSRGEGRVFTYLHLFGSKMKCTTASGCGYDKLGHTLANLATSYTKDNKDRSGDDYVFTQEQLDFLEALESCASGFDTYRTYGKYKFLRAI